MGTAVAQVAGKAGDGIFGGLGRSVGALVIRDVGLAGDVEVRLVAGPVAIE